MIRPVLLLLHDGRQSESGQPRYLVHAGRVPSIVLLLLLSGLLLLALLLLLLLLLLAVVVVRGHLEALVIVRGRLLDEEWRCVEELVEGHRHSSSRGHLGQGG